MFQQTEEDLLNDLKRSKTKNEAFKRLVDDNKQQLYFHIRAIVFDHEDTNDILQDTFIKAFQNINSFKGRSKLSTWLYRIATNQALDFLKSKSKSIKIDLEEYQEQLINNLSADDFFDGDQATILLHKAIASLPEKQRLVFKLKYFQELDYQAISEILDTSVGSLKASYHHATNKIKVFIENH